MNPSITDGAGQNLSINTRLPSCTAARASISHRLYECVPTSYFIQLIDNANASLIASKANDCRLVLSPLCRVDMNPFILNIARCRGCGTRRRFR